MQNDKPSLKGVNVVVRALALTTLLLPVVAFSSFVRLIKLDHGAGGTRSPCFSADMDHDGYIEFGQWCQDEGPVFQGWEIWKCIPPDSFVMVKQAENTYPPSDPTQIGNMYSWDVGDVDGDGLTELVGITFGGSPDYELFVQTIESVDYHGYPSEINWMNVYGTGGYFSTPFRLADLDQDGKKDIIFVSYGLNTVLVYENAHNDSNRLVWTDTLTGKNYYLSNWVWGDFDADGKMEFLSGGIDGDYVVWEHTGEDNQYNRIRIGSGLYDAYDVFGGRDMDGDTNPEFLISSIATQPWLGLYDGVGDNQYDSTLIATASWISATGYERSDVGDVDGDSLLEVVWSLRDRIILLDDAQHDYAQLGEWVSDHYGNSDQSLVTCADLTLDGADEIIVTGCFRTSILKWQGVGVEEGPESEDMNLWTSITPGGTEIHYSLSSPSSVNINIYDCSGRMVGDYELESNAGDNVFVLSESVVNPGVYFIRITTSTNSTTCKTIQIR